MSASLTHQHNQARPGLTPKPKGASAPFFVSDGLSAGSHAVGAPQHQLEQKGLHETDGLGLME